MIEQRLEKKFVYDQGDLSYNLFILNSMFKKICSKKNKFNIFDTRSYHDVWDNINGVGKRKKLRIRWYNNIENSDVFFEEKKKINFVTRKTVKKVGNFRDFNQLSSFLKSNEFLNGNFFKGEKNFIKTIFIQYQRNYFELPNKKLRLTIDNELRIYNQFPKKFMNLDETILELKYDLKNSNYVNKLIKFNNLKNRNKKFSKYVYSFISSNESGFI